MMQHMTPMERRKFRREQTIWHVVRAFMLLGAVWGFAWLLNINAWMPFQEAVIAVLVVDYAFVRTKTKVN